MAKMSSKIVRLRSTVTITTGVFLLQIMAVAPLLAQEAWGPAKNQAALSFTYQRLGVQNHLFSAAVTPDGSTKLDLGQIDSNTSFLNADFGITDHLFLSGGVGYISSKYDGTSPENPSLDDGNYHGTFQDLTVQLRYMAASKPLVVTPFGGVVYPTHRYPTFGHVVVGSDLYQYLAGVSLGRVWGRQHPTYAQATGGYSLFQKHEEHHLKRTITSLEVGNFVTKWAALRAFGTWQH